jgi:hypothetical protein
LYAKTIIFHQHNYNNKYAGIASVGEVGSKVLNWWQIWLTPTDGYDHHQTIYLTHLKQKNTDSIPMKIFTTGLQTPMYTKGLGFRV